MTNANSHPYKNFGPRAFWSLSVAHNFDPNALIEIDEPLIRRTDKIVSAGSCFASNVPPYLVRFGFNYFRSEIEHPAFPELAHDVYGYGNFSAAYGNIYTVRHLLQLLRRTVGRFQPAERYWTDEGEIVDPFRPGLKFRARSVDEFDALTSQHLTCARRAFAEANVFILTLGLTEAWTSVIDGAVYPACPGTVAGSFDPKRHRLHNFSAAETLADLDAFVTELKEVNPGCRFIFTVSPQSIVATATNEHVLVASTYTKSVLRVAAQEVARRYPDVIYFPAYEIVMGPQAPKTVFDSNRRNVSESGVDAVMSALLGLCEDSSENRARIESVPGIGLVSSFISKTECEELKLDRPDTASMSGVGAGDAAFSSGTRDRDTLELENNASRNLNFLGDRYSVHRSIVRESEAAEIERTSVLRHSARQAKSTHTALARDIEERVSLPDGLTPLVRSQALISSPAVDARISTDPFVNIVKFANDAPKHHISRGIAGLPSRESEYGVVATKFDASFYRVRNSDALSFESDPLGQFMTEGWQEGRSPVAWFSICAYLGRYYDVLIDGVNPFVHYILHGERERRVAEPALEARREHEIRDQLKILRQYFDTPYYTAQWPSVDFAKVDPVLHYYHHGWRHRRSPCKWFSVEDYLHLYVDVKTADMEPLSHYISHGKVEGREPSRGIVKEIASEFDQQYYLSHNLPLNGLEPIEHFVAFGWRHGFNPRRDFSISDYLRANPDVGRAKINPFWHYIMKARASGDAPFPKGVSESKSSRPGKELELSTGAKSLQPAADRAIYGRSESLLSQVDSVQECGIELVGVQAVRPEESYFEVRDSGSYVVFSALPPNALSLVLFIDARPKCIRPKLGFDWGDGFHECDAVVGAANLIIVRLNLGSVSDLKGIRVHPAEDPCGVRFQWSMSRQPAKLSEEATRRIDLARKMGSVVALRDVELKDYAPPKPGRSIGLNFLPRDPHQHFLRIAEIARREFHEENHSSASDSDATPLISFIVPVWNARATYLDDLLASFREQERGLAELVMVDDGSTLAETLYWLRDHTGEPGLIIHFGTQNYGIADTTNKGLALARGVWVGFVDHDDALAPFAVAALRRTIAQNPDAKLIYTDEMIADENLIGVEFFLKPAFDDVLLSGVNYINHLTIYRRELIAEIGGLRVGFDGSQDYDILLRYVSQIKTSEIRHLPLPAYIWRRDGSSFSVKNVEQAVVSARRALSEAYSHSQARLVVDPAIDRNLHRIRFDTKIRAFPKVSIVIPNKDSPALISRVVRDIMEKTEYPSLEVIVVDNGTTEVGVLDLYRHMQSNYPNFRTIIEPGVFNFSRQVNVGVASSDGDLVLLLNNDIEVTEANWLKEMVSCFAYKNTGIVGARLLYPDGSIQHAGVIVGLGGLAGHWFTKRPRDHAGPMARLLVRSSISAVTGACMLISRECIERTGRFEESMFPIAYNDIDFCLRARKQGFRTIYTPFATLVHHESASRGSDERGSERIRFMREQVRLLEAHATDSFDDPSYSPWYGRDQSDPYFVGLHELPSAR